MLYFICRSNVMEKYNKITSKMRKNIVQQKVQQKVRNNYKAICA